MVLQRIHSFIQRIITFERCPSRLAFTCSLGIYIAISPLIGLHTAMIFLFGWMFAVSIPLLFVVSVLIHNPWTMVPVYALDHVFGKWVFELCKIDYLQWDPAWVETCNHVLKEYTGITGLSLSAFLVGGNLLGIGISVMLYPVMKRIFAKYLSVRSSSHAQDASFVTTMEDTSEGEQKTQ